MTLTAKVRGVVTSQILFGMLVFFSLNSYAEKSVKITVKSGETHIFHGFGASATIWNDLANAPQASIDSAAKLLYRDANLVVGQVFEWGDRDIPASELATMQAKWLKAVKSAKPDLKLWFMAVGPFPDGLEAYASSRAKKIKELRDLGFNIERTGVAGEPNQSKYNMDGPQFAKLAKMLRAELDKQGLTKDKVKIHGPQCSSIDGKGMSFTQAIIDNALDAVDNFAFHSYNMGMTKEYRDMLLPYTKDPYNMENIVTEASFLNAGTETGGEPIYNAISFCERSLNDINLGVSYWLWFRGIDLDPKGNPWSGNTMIQIDMDDPSIIRPFLKYYFLKQISNTYKPETKMRLCYTDMSGGNRYKYMEFTYGDKPPLNAGAGINPDGKWVMAVVNSSGTIASPLNDTVSWGGEKIVVAKFAPAESYNITFHVEELVDSGDIDFEVIRTNKDVQLEKRDNVTMHNGDVKVTIEPRELITLKSVNALTAILNPVGVSMSKSEGIKVFNSLKNSRSIGIKFSVPVNSNDLVPVNIAVYNMQGTIINTLTDSKMNSGEMHTIFWDGCNVAGKHVSSGMYVIKANIGNINKDKLIFVR